MSFDLTHILDEAKAQLEACPDKEALGVLRVKYLGRKGLLQDLMGRIPGLPPEERRGFGARVNELKKSLEALFAGKESALDGAGEASAKGFIDVTLPGKMPLLGRLHPLTQVGNEVCGIFSRLGFKIFQGPEAETEFHNFEALNIPLDHPSRDAFDTFYLRPFDASRPGFSGQEKKLLRSHTSPAQIRALKNCPPPMAVVVPGRVYRPDAADASHSFMFHQVEGIAVDKDIRFSDLKGILIAFAKEMFGPETRMRFRPSFFPFTEPSAEVDISCFACAGRGCSVCKKSGWLEILGCGMVHPHVFKSAGLDAKKWRGLAFGMGVERVAMLKYGINDIRLFFENDIRFLEQF
ncbi:MAG: phenylalanine--tRNA ligase subunit alpha [Candidatus Omnitrophica bacterium]|nr:phenylalanine--tRNA ligase subunit alpha [Candidatus Omnitrophota bacterium]MDD5574045.1 phenylalanine--tRNA ligase subunit alpha [Candidatus Omnitrophota bacterium]